MRTILLFTGMCLAWLVSSCAKEKTNENPTPAVHINEVNLTPYFGANAISLDSVYTFSDGVKIQFSEIKCYFHGLKAGSNSIFDYALFDYRTTGKKVFSGPGTIPNSDAIYFDIGVLNADNHADPSAWPNNHPLNISVANDMHWDWNPGYIFIKIEAKLDTIPDQNLVLNHTANYHVGTDAFFSSKALTGANWLAFPNKHQLNLKLDMIQMFKPSGNEIDFSSEYLTHSASGQELLTEKIRQHFLNALVLE